MRFYFCGGLDCPDWVLAQIAYASKLTSLKFKSLFKEVVLSILNGKVDDVALAKLTNAGKIDIKDMEPCFAAIHFILCSACSNNVGVEILNDELQQLGLPKEHTQALCKLYASEFDTIRESLCQRSLKLNHISSLDFSSINIQDDNMTNRVIKIDMRVRSRLSRDQSPDKRYSVLATTEKTALLLDDLNKILAEM